LLFFNTAIGYLPNEALGAPNSGVRISYRDFSIWPIYFCKNWMIEVVQISEIFTEKSVNLNQMKVSDNEKAFHLLAPFVLVLPGHGISRSGYPLGWIFNW
jgi:hypothetical protein